ncbi:MAG: dUTP diphosphatase [Synergistaceae bacterium]|nr:dUTP diphosphatase [Synergistaceae bacterium]
MPQHEITVKIWREAATIKIPEYATPGSAGVDLCSMKYCIIKPGELTMIPTGIRLAIPEGYEGQIRPRSGLALNHRIIIPNAPGTIDSDYRGEIMIMLMNMGEDPFSISFGDRIAQLVFVPVAHANFEPVKQLDATQRGSGGFGSTGIK